MAEISSRCVDRLRDQVRHGLHHEGTTYYAPRLVDDDEPSFSIKVDNFHRPSGDGRLVPMYDIPEPEVQSHKKHHSEVEIPNSIRSPFRMMVSGLAIFPLMVVTPDSRAYL